MYSQWTGQAVFQVQVELTTTRFLLLNVWS